MDGNSRWAAARSLPRRAGHAAGAAALVTAVSTLAAWGVPAVTVFAWSAENRGRGPPAAASVLAVARRAARAHAADLAAAGVRLAIVGDRAALPASLNEALDAAVATTAAAATPPSMTLTVALAYGGRDDVVAAAQALAAAAVRGEVDPSAINASSFSASLALGAVLPPELRSVDLLLRTSGERRLSNFVLWEAAYAELVFVPTLWPDVTPAVLAGALREYAARKRRFGGLGERATEGEGG